jgi:hypothetical protein
MKRCLLTFSTDAIVSPGICDLWLVECTDADLPCMVFELYRVILVDVWILLCGS